MTRRGRHLRRARPWALVALLPLVLAFAIAQPSDEQRIVGRYESTFTVSRTCGFGPAVGSSTDVPVSVTRVAVGQLELYIRGSKLSGTISRDFNFDVVGEGTDFVGHFTFAPDGSVKLSGVLGARLCNVDDPAEARAEWTVRGTRPPRRSTASPSPGTTAPPTPDVDLAFESYKRFREICSDEAREEQCDRSSRYARQWGEAMLEDVRALKGPSDATLRALLRLRRTVSAAAEMGSLTVVDRCHGELPAFPLVRALLPVFGRLFVQGAAGAGHDNADAVQKAANLADELLAVAGTRDALAEEAASCPA